MLNAAVIGLGQAGSRFDEEPRPSTWSHSGAYLDCPDLYRVTGGADIESGNRDRFVARCPDAAVFDDGATMARELRPDVISVCVPPRGRADLVERVLAAHRPKVLICEKPLDVDPESRRRLVAACSDAGVPLLVNYNRRFATVYRKARAAIAEGRLGKVTAITVHAPNRLWSVGSHAVDMMLFLANEAPEARCCMPLPALEEGGEPACDLVCRFPSGIAGRVLTTGFRDMAMFEADVIGTGGRLRVSQRGMVATFAPFGASSQYVGYRTLGDDELVHRTAETESTFENLVREAAAVADGCAEPSSTGAQALATEEILDWLAAQYGERAGP